MQIISSCPSNFYDVGGSDGKESACNVGNLCSIPGSGRSPGGRHGNPLQYSCLENAMDRGAWWATVHEVTNRHDWVTKQQQQTLINQYLDERWGFPSDSVVKNSFANGGDKGSILGWGRSPGEENSNPLQYSFLGNPMDSRDWRATVHGVAKESTKQLNSNRSGVGWLWSTG